MVLLDLKMASTEKDVRRVDDDSTVEKAPTGYSRPRPEEVTRETAADATADAPDVSVAFTAGTACICSSQKFRMKLAEDILVLEAS